MSVVDKPKGRMRSASSPAKSFKSGIFAPAADSLPLLAPDTSDHGDQSVESFAQGLDRLNSEYKKSMLSEFSVIRNQIIAHQKLIHSSEIQLMTERVKENQFKLVENQNEMNSIKKDNAKQLLLLEASWTLFEKKKGDAAVIFAKWKSKRFTAARDKLVSHIAIIHNHASIMRKVMNGWRGVVGSSWKSAFEKKIKREAEISIQEISRKYEDQISKMHYQLTQANLKLKEAESKTDLKEAEMKRALMRGVCALNMEAMSVFRDKTIVPDLPKEKQVTQNSSDQSFEAHVIPEDNYQKTFQYTGNMKKNQDTKITRVLVTRHQ